MPENEPSVAEVLVRCLEAEGVQYIFGVPGEENENFLFALDESDIEFVPTRHEQGAAFMADVWGRVTGRAGVCLATLGPGATNLLTGVADAHLDKAPLVAITAQGSLDRLHHESHQRLDVVGLFGPVTRWNTSITSPEIAPEAVRKAFKLAQQEKPGATHLELPEDVAAAPATVTEPIEPRTVRRSYPDPQALDEAFERLRRSQRPLILAGNGAIRTRASRELTRLAEEHGLPVAHTFMGKGGLSDRSENSLFAVGLGFRDYVMKAVDAADLIITVGYDIAEVAPGNWNLKDDRPLVHLDFEPAEVYEHYQPQVEVVADLAASLRALRRKAAEADLQFETDWYRGVRQRILNDIEGWPLRTDRAFTVPGVLKVLRSQLNDEDLLISDVGSHKMWIARNYPTYCAGGCLISNGLASMGIALPGAIAAALANGERRVVGVMGDGGFLMNSQELETATRLGVAVTLIVLRDDDYGLIRWKQERSRGDATGTALGNPEIPAYAASFGAEGYRPASEEELRDTLRAALASPGVSVVDVPIDPDVNGELTERLQAYWENGGRP